MELGVDRIIEVSECRDRSDQLEGHIRAATDKLLRFVREDVGSIRLMDFERTLWSRIALLFRLHVALFLAVQHERLDLEPCRVASEEGTCHPCGQDERRAGRPGRV